MRSPRRTRRFPSAIILGGEHAEGKWFPAGAAHRRRSASVERIPAVLFCLPAHVLEQMADQRRGGRHHIDDDEPEADEFEVEEEIAEEA